MPAVIINYLVGLTCMGLYTLATCTLRSIFSKAGPLPWWGGGWAVCSALCLMVWRRSSLPVKWARLGLLTALVTGQLVCSVIFGSFRLDGIRGACRKREYPSCRMRTFVDDRGFRVTVQSSSVMPQISTASEADCYLLLPIYPERVVATKSWLRGVHDPGVVGRGRSYRRQSRVLPRQQRRNGARGRADQQSWA